jgi:hypothetical protein
LLIAPGTGLIELPENSLFEVRCHKISKDFQRDMKIVIAYCYLAAKPAEREKETVFRREFIVKWKERLFL